MLGKEPGMQSIKAAMPGKEPSLLWPPLRDLKKPGIQSCHATSPARRALAKAGLASHARRRAKPSWMWEERASLAKDREYKKS